MKFANQGDQLFLIVGVAKEFQLNPRVSNGGFLYTYKYVGHIAISRALNRSKPFNEKQLLCVSE